MTATRQSPPATNRAALSPALCPMLRILNRRTRRTQTTNPEPAPCQQQERLAAPVSSLVTSHPSLTPHHSSLF